ncbi:MAG: response regulator [Alphaproteobacteria bacterium]|nr:response regulator [Alphaproteobacteria bacterium]
MARIAVIEDEEAIRNLIIEELNDGGHETFPAEDGEQGLNIILGHSPDLILSDITMPRLNGRQLLRKLRENHPAHAKTPFIFLSALADQHDVVKGLRIGADDYVTKPIDFDMLLARIDARLRTVTLLDSEHDDDVTLDESAEEAKASAPSDGEAGPSIDHGSTAEDEATEKACKIAREKNGTMVAGHVETISMEAIRRKCGGEWERVSRRVFRIANETIKNHLTANDAVSVTPTNDFIICFAEINETFAKLKVQEIAEEIHKTLFGATRDSEISQVKAEAKNIELSPADLADKQGFFSRVKGRILSRSKELLNVADQKLVNAYRNDLVRLSTVFTTKGEATRMKSPGFAPEISSKISDWAKPGNVQISTLLELDKIMLDRTASFVSESSMAKSPTMLVPLHYSTVDDEQLLDCYIQAYGGISIQKRRHLVLNVVCLPENLNAGGSPFDRLAGLGRTRAIHIENPKQVIDLDFKRLQVGIGLISHRAAMLFQDQGMKLLAQKMKSVGAKLIVRDVLDDATLTPEELGADLVLSG